MIENLFNSWQQEVAKSSNEQSLPMFQRRNLFIKLLDALFTESQDIQFLLPELIDFTERTCSEPSHFLNALFLLNDLITYQERDLRQHHFDAALAKKRLQELLIKIGSYFAHLRMDMNITRQNVAPFESDRVEPNILHLDHNFRIEKTNSILLAYFGYEKKEVIGKPVNILFSPPSQTLLTKSLAQLKNNLRFKIDLEVEAQNKLGRHFQVLLKISRTNIYQVPARYIAYIQDNTYIHETKSMLNLMSMALESVGEGIVLLEPNENGKILYVNEAIETMSGFQRHQLLGKAFAALRNTAADSRLEKEILSASLTSGWQGELVNHHKKGHEYIVYLHTQPVKDEYNNIVAIVGIMRDITRQKARETQILHLKQFVEHIINNLPHYVFVTDEQMHIRFWNQSLEENLSLSTRDVIDKSTFEVLPELRKFHMEMAAKSVLNTGEMFTKKIFTPLAGGEQKYYQVIVTKIHTASERQLLWTLFDITKEELLKIQITWQNARLKFLENFSQILNSSLDLKTIFSHFTRELKNVLPYKSLAFLMPYHADQLQFNLFYHSTEETGDFPSHKIVNLEKCQIYQHLVKSLEPVLENTANLPENIRDDLKDIYDFQETGQIIALPIFFENELLGILQIGHAEPDFFRKNDLEFLQQIASHLAIALKNSFYFNLIELQNKKLFILNSIFSIPQNSSGIPIIYQNTLTGIQDLLKCEHAAIYQCTDGENWQRVAGLLNKTQLPVNLYLPVSHLTASIHVWDRFTPSPIGLNSPQISQQFHSGLFTFQKSGTRYLAILAGNVQVPSHSVLKSVSTLVQDILQQMALAIEQIHLFDKVTTAEKEWETTFNTVRIGLAVVNKDFRFLRVNQAFLSILEYESSDILGKSCKETFCKPHESAECCTKLRHNIKSKVFETEYYDPDIQKTLIRTFYPIIGTDGEFKGGVFSVYDVSQQRRQEEQIRFLSKFPETNPNLIINIASSGEVRYINPSARRLLADLNLSEKDVRQILPSDLDNIIQTQQDHQEMFLERIHNFSDHSFQYLIYRPTGEENYYFYGTDITERVELQRQLLQTERIRAVGEMAAGVAHDFNNLLATILGRTQLLLLKTENKQFEKELKVIERAAMDGGQIVKRMQEVTRERRTKNYEPLDLNELIKEAIILTANKLKISTQLKGKQVQLHTDFEENLVVKGNPVELKEVFTNLLLNAYDAMPNGGDIFISTRKLPDQYARVVFQDTGSGMSEEVKNKIFNPFFTTKGEKGTGLGLSIVYRTVTGHGGNIKVNSELNRGTTFDILLPLTTEPIKKKRTREKLVNEKIREVRLMIVDDEPELLETMAEILRLKFHAVEIASGGKEALEKLAKQHFEVILTDLGMPEMSGWELAKIVKDKVPDSKVILVTGWGDQAREELRHHPYVDDVLSKPYDLRDLLQKISHFYSTPLTPQAAK